MLHVHKICGCFVKVRYKCKVWGWVCICGWMHLVGPRDSDTKLHQFWLRFLSMPILKGFTPQKLNIDTKNGHIEKEIHFPNHHFGYSIHLSFQGCI